MKKIIYIIKATASGKTSFALDVAKKILDNNLSKSLIEKLGLDIDNNYLGVDLISVDSRQVYKGLEILSGADVSEDFEEANTRADYRYFKHKNLNIFLHGVSIIDLQEEWSVAHFKDFATKVILNSFKNPGTGNFPHFTEL